MYRHYLCLYRLTPSYLIFLVYHRLFLRQLHLTVRLLRFCIHSKFFVACPVIRFKKAENSCHSAIIFIWNHVVWAMIYVFYIYVEKKAYFDPKALLETKKSAFFLSKKRFFFNFDMPQSRFLNRKFTVCSLCRASF